MKKNYNFFNYVSIFFSIVLGLVSIYYFRFLEPGIDQIRYISWAKSLNDSNYFINLKYLKDSNLFFFDPNSFVINLLKTGYKDIGNIFNLTPVLLLYILNLSKLSPILLFNVTSIIFFSLYIYVTTLIFYYYTKRYNKIKNYTYFYLIFLLFLLNYYTFIFSPLGIHNIAVFFLLLTFYNLLKFDLNKRNFIYLFISSTLGIFSHKINPFIIIPLINIFFIYKKNYKILIKYNILTSIFLLPLFAIILTIPSVIEGEVDYAQFDISIFNFLKNIYLWFFNIYKTLGPFITFLFLIGICFLSKNLHRNISLIIVIFIHLILGIFINTFTLYYIRTSLYITPFILIVSLFGFAYLWKKYQKFLNPAMICILVFINLIGNIYLLISKNKNSKIYQTFYKYNGKIKPSLDEISKFTDGYKILFSSNTSEDYFKIYQNAVYKKNGPQIKPLYNLKKEDQFKYFYQQKNYSKFILVSITSDESSVYEQFNNLKKNKIFFETCKLNLKSIYSNKKLITGDYNIYLHKIYCT